MLYHDHPYNFKNHTIIEIMKINVQLIIFILRNGQPKIQWTNFIFIIYEAILENILN